MTTAVPPGDDEHDECSEDDATYVLDEGNDGNGESPRLYLATGFTEGSLADEMQRDPKGYWKRIEETGTPYRNTSENATTEGEEASS